MQLSTAYLLVFQNILHYINYGARYKNDAHARGRCFDYFNFAPGETNHRSNSKASEFFKNDKAFENEEQT